VIDRMPRPRPPHLHCETTRHGRRVWYVRIGRGARIRIPGEFGSEAVHKCLSGRCFRENSTTIRNALKGHARLADRPLSGGRCLAEPIAATRRQRDCILKQILATAGAEPIGQINRAAVIAGRERRAKTPFQARHFVATMRGLFRWAVDAELAKADPTQGVKVRRPRTDGFPAWDDADIETFETRWPIGTRERIMFDIFRFTGLRRGDAARLGRPHVRNGVIAIDTEKGRARVTIPMLPELARTLEAGPTGDLTYIATVSGNPMPKESVGNLFRDACRAAGIRKSAHGLRKYAAALLANRGATVAQLEAIFGWEGGRMAALYTRSADRAGLAASAITKLRK
jgi:integrase